MHFHNLLGLTGRLWQTVTHCDGEGLPTGFDLSQVPLPAQKHHHPGASSTPALLLHSELHPEWEQSVSVVCVFYVNVWLPECVCVGPPVGEGDRQFSLVDVLVAFGQQTEELCLKVGLQQTVVLGLM